MERRKFVLTAIIGMCSTNTLIASSFKLEGEQKDFILLLGGKKLTQAQQDDPELKKNVLEKSATFLEIGYSLAPNPLQIATKSGESLFFYWLVLDHPNLGVLEKTLLLFKKERNKTLISLPPISGKLADALSFAVQELSLTKSNEDLLDLLIPCQDEITTFGFFTTKAGKLYIKDIWKNNHSTSDIKIYEGDSVVWSKKETKEGQLSILS